MIPEYSFVIPVLNERETLPELYRRLAEVVAQLDCPDYEARGMACKHSMAVEIVVRRKARGASRVPRRSLRVARGEPVSRASRLDTLRAGSRALLSARQRRPGEEAV